MGRNKKLGGIGVEYEVRFTGERKTGKVSIDQSNPINRDQNSAQCGRT
jgi:hypothetical protein